MMEPAVITPEEPLLTTGDKSDCRESASQFESTREAQEIASFASSSQDATVPPARYRFGSSFLENEASEEGARVVIFASSEWWESRRHLYQLRVVAWVCLSIVLFVMVLLGLYEGFISSINSSCSQSRKEKMTDNEKSVRTRNVSVPKNAGGQYSDTSLNDQTTFLCMMIEMLTPIGFFFCTLGILVGHVVLFASAYWNHDTDNGGARAEQRERNLRRHHRQTQQFEMPPLGKALQINGASGPITIASDEESRQCAICLESLAPGESCRRVPCAHIFHANCLDGWLQDCHTCPSCRADVRALDDVQEQESEQQNQRRRMIRIFITILCSLAIFCLLHDYVFGTPDLGKT
eukprot:gnl/MRDRNA2_/MRDRNA2_67172_c0_seq2.p1 gnl/MRDRNA2_/MRDRNA2_67172_c0~~gnl/MRDRNA2_/MRDRNA2_67172_c0_seq2.p1  ORF type:complete len:349 (-),score=37.73 gnl/MRDRNA2_/MRDRNA2_67172_c0_seq2:30-1076(-)